jgi:uncharacterized membrane protein YphA (DoxX/SURF4 family)
MAADATAGKSFPWANFRAYQPWITLAARLGLAVVLFWAGWAKITEPTGLKQLAVSEYDILPKGMVPAVATGLPLLEICLAALLVVGFATRFAAILSGLLMIVFIAGIISAWARGLRINCGCFGGAGQVADPHYLREIFRDLGFVALAAWIAVLPKCKLSLDRALGLYTD